jgi:uncharacterized damage-inducible protein DinB
MRHLPALVADNILLLEQCADILEHVPPGIYALPDPRCHGSCIGGHVRHCLEHYASFLDGLDAGLIDYERRARDRRLQTDPAAAGRALRQTASALARGLAFAGLDRPLRIVAEGDTSDGDITASSIGRELGFLLSHTIHHCALIAVLLRLGGLDAPAGFGLAPSTVRHRDALASRSPAPDPHFGACAR